MTLFRLAHVTLELRFEKTYETLSEAVIQSMELLDMCFPHGALTPPHIPTVPRSTNLTDSSPSPTPAVNWVFLVSLRDALKHPFNFTIPVVQSQATQKEKQGKKPPHTQCQWTG